MQCATPLARACAGCGADLPAEARFCPQCAHPVQGDGQAAAAAAARAPAKPDPRAYTPRHLAEKILQSKSALEGERKQVTVLFADVKGSMDLAADLDPESWHGILDRFFRILTEGVHRFEGTVNQYTGDGIMALFGAPIAHEDHAQRACYAALELRAELRDYADEVRRTHGVSFSTRMGLNSGDVIVGKIGDDLRMDYTAQGHTVGLAQRMEGLAEPGAVFLTEHTQRLVEGYFALRSLGAFDLKGVTGPVEVHELQGVGTLRTRLDRSRERGFSRFVGRSREVETLESARERAVAGHGQVVGVVAEAGVGKSRLCVEFLESCRAQGLSVYEAHCPPHGRTLHLLPIFELLRSVFGITDADRDQAVREKIAGRLLLLDREFDAMLPLVWEFFGVADPARPAPTLDSGERQRQLYAFVRRLVQARSEREPAVLLIDDLHWIDPASDAFVAQLTEVVASTRTLLLVNFRPEYRADWMQRSYYQQLPLATLGREDIRALAADLLGADSSVATLPEAIAERTGGNPFFTEEVVQSLAESGQLEGTRGRYRLVAPLDAIEVPGSVRAILAARIDRLAEREKRVLQTAAIVGREFPESILQSVSELPGEELRGALDTLQSAEFLYEQALYPEHEYTFKHPLTHEVAYDSQLSERRRTLHAAVARAIEARDPERAGDRAALLAHHWDAAEQYEPAAHWHRLAARSVAMLDIPEAVRHWERVRELVDLLPASAERDERAAEARGQILWFRTRVAADMSPEDARQLFEEACAVGVESRGTVLAHVGYANYVVYAGRVPESRLIAERGVEVADRLGDPDLRVSARWPVGIGCFFTGDFERAIDVAGSGIEACAGDPTVGTADLGLSVYTMFKATRIGAFAYQGRTREALAEREYLDTPAARAHAYSYQLACCFQVLAGWLTGDFGSGLASVRRAVEGLDTTNPAAHAFSRHMLGVGFALVGEWEQAAAALGDALESMRTSGSFRQVEAETCAWLARVDAERGEYERARVGIAEAREIAERTGARLPLLLAHVAAARLLWHERGTDAADEIEAELQAGIERSREIGARLLEPWLWIDRATLRAALGDESGRRDHLESALELFREMEAPRHIERVERELGG
jgi:class 3 adenylate cyclase/tetratricopeptide (TPR) repeat protein